MPILSLDTTDLRILAALQARARQSNVELAEAVGLSQSATLRRVRDLEDRGTLTGYVALVDPAAVGLGVSVMVNVSLERQGETTLQVFETAIRGWPEVMECYLMTGDADYLLRIVVPDLPAYERFLMDRLTRVPGVASIKSSFALKQVVHRTALPMTHLADRRPRRPPLATAAGQATK
ncbi:MAG: Lrp/AsnC family transcriptional regulator [Alphaproteobacteria bacterium]|nr:Lrp/AsnC family transcriptional regulator [Alphaproteobacteria bacterium]